MLSSRSSLQQDLEPIMSVSYEDDESACAPDDLMQLGSAMAEGMRSLNSPGASSKLQVFQRGVVPTDVTGGMKMQETIVEKNTQPQTSVKKMPLRKAAAPIAKSMQVKEAPSMKIKSTSSSRKKQLDQDEAISSLLRRVEALKMKLPTLGVASTPESEPMPIPSNDQVESPTENEIPVASDEAVDKDQAGEKLEGHDFSNKVIMVPSPRAKQDEDHFPKAKEIDAPSILTQKGDEAIAFSDPPETTKALDSGKKEAPQPISVNVDGMSRLQDIEADRRRADDNASASPKSIGTMSTMTTLTTTASVLTKGQRRVRSKKKPTIARAPNFALDAKYGEKKVLPKRASEGDSFIKSLRSSSLPSTPERSVVNYQMPPMSPSSTIASGRSGWSQSLGTRSIASTIRSARSSATTATMTTMTTMGTFRSAGGTSYKRKPTVPHAPKFALDEKYGEKKMERKITGEGDSFVKSLRSSPKFSSLPEIACGSPRSRASFGSAGSVRSNRSNRSNRSGRSTVTVPKSPSFALDKKYGEKQVTPTMGKTTGIDSFVRGLRSPMSSCSPSGKSVQSSPAKQMLLTKPKAFNFQTAKLKERPKILSSEERELLVMDSYPKFRGTPSKKERHADHDDGTPQKACVLSPRLSSPGGRRESFAQRQKKLEERRRKLIEDRKKAFDNETESLQFKARKVPEHIKSLHRHDFVRRTHEPPKEESPKMFKARKMPSFKQSPEVRHTKSTQWTSRTRSSTDRTSLSSPGGMSLQSPSGSTSARRSRKSLPTDLRSPQSDKSPLLRSRRSSSSLTNYLKPWERALPTNSKGKE